MTTTLMLTLKTVRYVDKKVPNSLHVNLKIVLRFCRPLYPTTFLSTLSALNNFYLKRPSKMLIDLKTVDLNTSQALIGLSLLKVI